MFSLIMMTFVLFLVQHECIPQAILGMDILCQAKSGMGKTAVFVLATLQQIEPVDGQVRFSFNSFKCNADAALCFLAFTATFPVIFYFFFFFKS